MKDDDDGDDERTPLEALMEQKMQDIKKLGDAALALMLIKLPSHAKRLRRHCQRRPQTAAQSGGHPGWIREFGRVSGVECTG